MPVPKYHALLNPVLQAIKALGGSASINELDGAVVKSLSLTEDAAAQPHSPDDLQTEVEYQLAWARTYLKKFGLLENSVRGVWVVTAKGRETEKVDPGEVRRSVGRRGPGTQKLEAAGSGVMISTDSSEVAEVILEPTWKDQLLSTLRTMPPAVFERLCQRLLRESGFVEVRVTGRSGDGGIDGVGRVKIGGLLGFPVVFQCKRYQGSVAPRIVREFRGAMMGRADRGLIVTTGTFSADARREATRDGVPPIDLMDGDELMEKLKELRLGVSIRMIEEVSVEPQWFADI